MSEITQKTGKVRLGHVQNRLENGQKQFRSFGIKTAILNRNERILTFLLDEMMILKNFFTQIIST